VATTAGTPPDVLERLNREMRAVIAQPAVQKQLTDWGGAAKASSPAEFRARVERDIIALRKVVADRRIETEP
jgi:tripartite-type tricarboxylate transporter receptor subunit TctC